MVRRFWMFVLLLALGCGLVVAAPRAGAAPTGLPSKPVVTSASGQGLSLVVAWEPNPAVDEVTRYTATATPVVGQSSPVCPTPQPRTVTAAGTSTMGRINGVCAGVAYRVTLTATNLIGTSRASDPTNAEVPLTAQVPDTPQLTQAVGRDRQLLLAWEPPAFDGGSPLTGYTLTITHDTTVIATHPVGTVTTFTATGLVNDTTYTLNLVATNTVGASAASTATGTPSAGYAPTPPVGLTVLPDTQGNITASWQAPLDDGGRPVTGYTLTWQQAVLIDDTWQPLTGATVHRLTTTNLTLTATSFEDQTAAYLFAVTATNTMGASSPATATNAVSPQVTVNTDTIVLSAATVDTATTMMWALPTPAETNQITTGRVIVAAPTPTIPNGVLERVTAVDKTATHLTITYTRAKMDDVFTQLTMSVDMDPASNQAPAGGTIVEGQTAKVIPKTSGVQGRIEQAVSPSSIGAEQTIAARTSLSFNLDAKPAFAKGSATIEASTKVRLNVDWGHTTITAEAKASAILDAQVGIQASKEWKLADIQGPTVSFTVGIVPVWIQAKVPVFFNASGNVTVGFHTEAVVGASVTWDSNHPGTLTGKSLNQAPQLASSPIPGLTATGSLQADLKIEVIAAFYSVGGPSAALTLRATIDVNLLPNPGDPFLTGKLTLNPTVGVSIDFLNIYDSASLKLGSLTLAHYQLDRPPTATYTITGAPTHAPVGATIQLAATRNDGQTTTSSSPELDLLAALDNTAIGRSTTGTTAQTITPTWSLVNGTTGDSITPTGLLTLGEPAFRTLTIAVGDSTGAGARVDIRVGPAFDSPSLSVSQPANDLAINATWTAPTDTGESPISSYTITTSPTTQASVVPATTRSVKFDKIPAGDYTVNLYATNTKGQRSPVATRYIHVWRSCNNQWTGTTTDLWSDTTKWSAGRTPANTDWICSATSTGPTLPTGTNLTIAGLDARGTNMTINSTLTITEYLESTGVLSGSGSVTIANGATGSLTGAVNVPVINSGTLHLAHTDYLSLATTSTSPGSITNNAAMDWAPNSYSLGSYSDGTITNNTGATFTITGTTPGRITSKLINKGTLTATTPTTLSGTNDLTGGTQHGTLILADGTTTGLVSVPAGLDLTVTGTLTTTDPVTVQSGATASFQGVLSGSGSVTIANGATGSLTGAVNVPVINNGTLHLAHTDYLSLATTSTSPGSITNNAAMDWAPNGYSLGSYSDGTITNNTGATFTITGTTPGRITSKLINKGTLTATTPTTLSGTNDLTGGSVRLVVPAGVVGTTTPMLSVSGTLTRAGVLGVSLAEGVTFDARDSVVLVKAGSFGGQFAKVELADPQWRVASTATTMTMSSSAALSVTGVTAVAGDARAVVSWTPPNVSPAPSGFTITSTPATSTASAGSGTTSTTVTGLINGTAYTFTVVAQYADGTESTPVTSLPVTPAATTRTVSGTVTSGGSPVAVVKIAVFDAATGAGIASTTTNSDGVYTLGNLTATSVKVKATKDGYQTVYQDGKSSLASAAAVPLTSGTTTINISLPALKTVTGTVTSAGTPVAGVKIAVFDAATGAGIGATTTNSAGVYSLGNLSATSVKVKATKDGYQSVYQDGKTSLASAAAVLLGSGTTTIDISLSSRQTVTGTITTQTGTPIAGVKIAVFNAATGAGIGATTTNSAGVYNLGNLSATSVKVKATKDGYQSVYQDGKTSLASAAAVPLTAAGTTTVDISLSSRQTVTGTVTSAGTPIAGVKIAVFDATTGQGIGSTTTNNAGVYTLSNLTATSVKVKATKDGYRTVYQDGTTSLAEAAAVPLTPAGTTTVDIGLTPTT